MLHNDSLIVPKNASLSMYQPDEDVRLLTAEIQKDYFRGRQILNKPWDELNGRSVINDENNGQLMFNAFVDDTVSDPAEAWKWRGTRSKARNKGIAMHANLTSAYILPLFTAQNSDDEVDDTFSETMRDIIEWMAMPNNSNYQESFLQIVFGMITNPITYLSAEYSEVFQTIKEMNEEGNMTKKEILDEVLSGFNAPIYSSSQVMITNAFERNLQKQKRIIKRRFAEMSELEGKYGDHPNWPLITPGVRSMYNSEDGLFYDIKDTDSNQYLICEEIALSRREDLEIPYLNGIYFGSMESAEHNPIRHRDNRGAPKYNLVPFGYARIGQHFFYYKSMMNTLKWDNGLYDAMSEIIMNRAILETDAPIAVSGSDNIDTDVVFPGSVVTFEDPNAKVQRLLPEANFAAGFKALQETEKSIDNESLDPIASGALPPGSQRAYVIATMQQNAKRIIGEVSKSLAESIIKYGDLMKDIAINHITIPMIDEIVGEELRMKYRSFFLPNKKSDGRVVNKRIKFDDSLIGMEMTDKEKESAEFELLEKSGYPEHKEIVTSINPELFARYRYLSRVDTEEMTAKNDEYWQPVLLNLKTALAKDPYTNQEMLTKELMHSYFHSKGNKFTQKPPPPPQMGDPNAQDPNGVNQDNTFGNIVKSKSLGAAASGASPQV